MFSGSAQAYIINLGIQRGMDFDLASRLRSGVATTEETDDFLGDLLAGLQRDLVGIDLTRVAFESKASPEAPMQVRVNLLVQLGPELDALQTAIPAGSIVLSLEDEVWRVERLLGAGATRPGLRRAVARVIEGAPAPGAGAESTVAGHPVRTYPVALTTEALALGWARAEEAPEGAVVVASQELSPASARDLPGSVSPATVSISRSCCVRGPPEGEDLLWVLASLAGARALESLGVNDVKIKWPDDLHVGGRKIGGLKVINQLAPGRIESAIATFRINLNVIQDRFPRS